jgi:osmotically inducible protein OsmC
MITQQSQAVWRGGLKDGSGTFRSGSLEAGYSFQSRFEGGPGATPEGLIGAAHAGCFSMALSLILGEMGKAPRTIRTTATVTLDPKQLAITRSELETEAEVAGMSESEFRQAAEKAKQSCPVSKVLAGAEIVLKSARLAQTAAAR